MVFQNPPCVRMNLSSYSGPLMSSDTNSYPLQLDQAGCKMQTWIKPSRTRKDLRGKQGLTLNTYVQFWQEALNITRGGRDLHLTESPDLGCTYVLCFSYRSDAGICLQNQIFNAASNITTSSAETCGFLLKWMELDHLAQI